MSFFRRQRPVTRERAPAPSLPPAWSPGMPPRPQRQPQRDDGPRLQRPAFPFPPDQGYMTGGVNPDFDPCGAGPIKPSASSKSGEAK